MAYSDAFRRDMEAVRRNGSNAFIKNGVVDVDAHIAFVTHFNEFINHQLTPFKPIIDRDMRL